MIKKLSEWVWIIQVRAMVIQMRWGWYKYRKTEGHPISLRRAFFSQPPRFGAYEAHEEGCPDWALRDYKIVDE